MAEQNDLVVRILGDARGALKAFAEVVAGAKETSKESEKVGKNTSNAFGAIKTAVSRFMPAITAATVAMKAYFATMQAMEKAETIKKTAADLGITTDELQKLGYAAEASSSSMQSLTMGLRTMQKFMVEVQKGSNSASESLQRMGLSAADLKGMNPSEAFHKIVDGLNQIPDASIRAAVAQDIFGRSAKDMGELLRQGSGEIKKIGEEAQKAGRLLSTIELSKLNDAKDAVEESGRAWEGMWNKIGAGLSPLFKAVSETFTRIIDFISPVAVAVGQVFGGVLGIVVDAVSRMAKAIQMSLSGLVALLTGAVWKGITFVVVNIVRGAAVIGEAFKKAFDFIASSGERASASLGLVWTKAMKMMGQATQEEVDAADLKLQEAENAFHDAVTAYTKPIEIDQNSGLIGYLNEMNDNAGSILSDIVDQYSDTADEIIDLFADSQANKAFASMFDGVGEASASASAAVAAFGSMTNEQITWIREGALGMWQSLKDGAPAFVEAIAGAFGLVNKQREEFMEGHRERMIGFMSEMAMMDQSDKELQSARQFEFNANREVEEQRAVDAQVMLWRSGAMGKMQALQGVLGNLSVLMQSSNKEMFEVGRAAALAQNVVDTITSASSSYKFGAALGGPIVGAAFASTAVLAGLVRAQQLMAAKPPGKGGGGYSMPGSGGGGGMSAASNAESARSQTGGSSAVNVTLYGDSFSPDQVRGLISAINDQVGDNVSLRAQAGS